jgi:tetratricopeptide (TPR) repeat protein
MTETLPVQIARTIRAADGYLDLNLVDDAVLELKDVPTDYHQHSGYLTVVYRLCQLTDDWVRARDISKALWIQHAEDVGAWVNYAYAVRRAESIEAAREILITALAQFPKEAIISYNLGCYECQLGALDDARAYLRTAFELGPGFRDMALQDADLDRLHADIQQGV